MTRLDDVFIKSKTENRSALITYIMVSDPDYSTSLEVMENLSNSGSDVIELGMPFSDPMADGPTIQEAGNRSLKANGNIKNTFKILQSFREKNSKTAVILMGYYNPILYYGVEKFVNDALNSGADGAIIVDLPPEEEFEFTQYSDKAGLHHIKLISPKTDIKRAASILKNASGFIYYISVAGITGSKTSSISNIEKSIKMLRKVSDLPIAIGFGIKTPEQAKEIAKISDAVVVGSAIVNIIKKHIDNKSKLTERIANFVKDLKTACLRDQS